MKKIFSHFPVIFFMLLGITVNAQNSEDVTSVNWDKTTLTYDHFTEVILWENMAGQTRNMNETKSIEASYNLNEDQFEVNGTKANGEVEVWDVNGNTIAEKRSGDHKTIIKAKALPLGTYYISYSNGNYAEGTKLEIR